jgi:hypothetical protein
MASQPSDVVNRDNGLKPFHGIIRNSLATYAHIYQ